MKSDHICLYLKYNIHTEPVNKLEKPGTENKQDPQSVTIKGKT